MLRSIYLILLLAAAGCSHTVTVQARDEIIEVGDLVDDVKRKLHKWGLQEAHFAFAIAVKEEHESQFEFLERAEQIRRQDDFCEHPFYWVGPKTAASFKAMDGKLIAISKIVVLGRYAGDWTSESGFRSIDEVGRFSR